jgi:hypothetical protein
MLACGVQDPERHSDTKKVEHCWPRVEQNTLSITLYTAVSVIKSNLDGSWHCKHLQNTAKDLISS